MLATIYGAQVGKFFLDNLSKPRSCWVLGAYTKALLFIAASLSRATRIFEKNNVCTYLPACIGSVGGVSINNNGSPNILFDFKC